ncbi:hypothetical protein DSAG12_02645 [Promethearchaeum syntrophicum]|uniref:Uncharacterized protein n=1 Tax=Promethearchaeum syntrophicum TaxID=2594042 RepID=A0A5B9DCS5_9ARCH|nr:hypothetical protein [Candidatus Prometheoarchaeum syntrophicum]QEE16815.1 hypothetical protein DSAG12_02645 [Candidatus Prometheoarchaeum syntrophicum]
MDSNIDNILRNFVIKWRESKEKSKVFDEEIGFMNFPIPTQFFVFEFKHKAIPFYIILKTHFSNKKDLIIQKKGNFSLNNNQKLKNFQEELNSIFQIYFSKNEKDEILDLIARFLNNQFVGKEIEILKVGFRSSTTLINNISIGIYFGDWNKLNIEEDVKKNIKIQKEMENTFVNFMKSRYDRIDCIGAYLYPPIWIGILPVLSFTEKMQEIKLNEIIEKKIVEVDHRKVIYTSDGYFAVEIKNSVDGFNIEEKVEKSPEEISSILEMMNLLNSILLLKDFPINAIQRSNISSLCYYIPETNFLYFSVKSNSDASELLNDRQKHITNVHIEKKINIPLEIFKESIREVKMLAENNELKDFKELIITGLNSSTNYSHFEYPQSFILGWTIIEQYINNLYNKKLSLQNIPKGKNPSVYNKIKTLKSAFQINNKDYILLNKLRIKRNDYVHDLTMIDKKNAQTCLDFSLKLLKISYNEKISHVSQ